MLLNQARAQHYMRRHRLDALVATSPPNITYFSDAYSWLDRQFKEYMVRPGAAADLLPSFALLPLEGEPGLVVSALLAVNTRGLWVKDVRPYGDPGFDRSLPAQVLAGELAAFARRLDRPASGAVEGLVELLAERGLARARIGVELEGLPAATVQALRSALPGADLVDCANLIRLVRMVKSPEEVVRLEAAAALAEAAALASLAGARPGLSFLDTSYAAG